MIVLKKYNQHRRDCSIDLECENCGHKETDKRAYDDRNFWDNVIPNCDCEKCGKSTKSLGLSPAHTSTKYSAFEVV